MHRARVARLLRYARNAGDRPALARLMLERTRFGMATTAANYPEIHGHILGKVTRHRRARAAMKADLARRALQAAKSRAASADNRLLDGLINGRSSLLK